MAHPALRTALALAAALLALPSVADAQSTRRDGAHVDVVQGRAVLLGGGGSDAETIRRGESKLATGRAQLEVGAGSQARIAWRGTASVHVWGPASLEWSSDQGSLALTFHELAWADVEARTGEHQLYLPHDWHATFARSSFHLRGLSGGPSELRLHAGNAVVLDWRGSESTSLRPPMAVYPGSSVRLDTPRYQRVEVADRRSRGAWTREDTKDEQDTWPWRERADDDRQVRERLTLERETQTFDELPGQPDGEITRVRSYDSDGSSKVAPIRSRSRATRGNGATSAQVPVTPGRTTVEIVERPITDDRASLPRRGERQPTGGPAPRSRTTSRSQSAPLSGPGSSRPAPTGLARLDAIGSSESDQRPSTESTRRQRPRTELPETTMPGRSMTGDRQRDDDANARAARIVRGRKVKFDSIQWRGLDLADLNGTGSIAAERGSGVEVRVLGQGRAKVFVSSGAPGPRWCFTPTTDLLMHPGSVAVFEADGSLRMSFGKTEENEPVAGRPAYDELAD